MDWQTCMASLEAVCACQRGVKAMVFACFSIGSLFPCGLLVECEEGLPCLSMTESLQFKGG